jgi:hypothetical protein
MSGEAQFLLDSEVIKDIFAQIERDAMELCVNAPLGDDETRRDASGEVRAIRRVRQKLEALAKAKTNLPPSPVV